MLKNRLLLFQFLEKFELQRAFAPGDRAKPFELAKVQITVLRITKLL